MIFKIKHQAGFQVEGKNPWKETADKIPKSPYPPTSYSKVIVFKCNDPTHEILYMESHQQDNRPKFPPPTTSKTRLSLFPKVPPTCPFFMQSGFHQSLNKA